MSKWYVTLCEAHNYTSEFSVKDSECGVGQDQMVTLTQLLANWVIFKKKKKNSIYLFLAVLGLHCRSSFPLVMATGGYSSWGVQASHCCGFFCCGPQTLGAQASVAMTLGLSWSEGSSQIRNRTHVFCIGRQVLNHWATRGAPTGWPWTTHSRGLWSSCGFCEIKLNNICNACVLSRVQLHDPTDCNPPGSSVHGILQAKILE